MNASNVGSHPLRLAIFSFCRVKVVERSTLRHERTHHTHAHASAQLIPSGRLGRRSHDVLECVGLHLDHVVPVLKPTMHHGPSCNVSPAECLYLDGRIILWPTPNCCLLWIHRHAHCTVSSGDKQRQSLNRDGDGQDKRVPQALGTSR